MFLVYIFQIDIKKLEKMNMGLEMIHIMFS